MAIVINKPKPKAKELAPDPNISEFAEYIDNVGRLEGPALKVKEKINKLQEELKPYNKALKDLQGLMDDIGDCDDTFEELGTEFIVEAGAKGTSRSITNMKLIHEMMGDELFYQLATITLTNLDKYLIEPQREKVIETDRTSRTLKIVARK